MTSDTAMSFIASNQNHNGSDTRKLWNWRLYQMVTNQSLVTQQTKLFRFFFVGFGSCSGNTRFLRRFRLWYMVETFSKSQNGKTKCQALPFRRTSKSKLTVFRNPYISTVTPMILISLHKQPLHTGADPCISKNIFWGYWLKYIPNKREVYIWPIF